MDWCSCRWLQLGVQILVIENALKKLVQLTRILLGIGRV
jgi:hypothetical protein